MANATPEAAGRVQRLGGPDRVAALLLAMGPPVAGRLLKHFDTDELKRISQAATGLGPVAASEMEPLIEEFAGQFSAGLDLLGSPRIVEQLLSGVLDPDEIEALLSSGGAAEPSVWDRLAGLADGVLAKYLLQEHPQTIAYVLNRVSPACAAATMRHFSPELRDELMRRMLCARRATEAVQRIVVETLNSDLLGGSAAVTESHRHEHLAQIMNGMDRGDIEQILTSLEAVRPKAAKTLKGMLFTFEDMGRLSETARAAVVEAVTTDELVLALRGTEDAFRDMVLSALSSRARRMVENELSNGQAASKRDVREAQRAIADIALDLAGRGVIQLDASREEDVV